MSTIESKISKDGAKTCIVIRLGGKRSHQIERVTVVARHAGGDTVFEGTEPVECGHAKCVYVVTNLLQNNAPTMGLAIIAHETGQADQTAQELDVPIDDAASA